VVGVNSKDNRAPMYMPAGVAASMPTAFYSVVKLILVTHSVKDINTHLNTF